MIIHIKKSLPIVLVLTFLASCGTAKINYKNPNNVAFSFYKTLSEGKLEETKSMVTKETLGMITLLETLQDALSDIEKEERASMSKFIKKAKCKVNGDTAECTVCCSEAGEFGEEILYLKKIDEKWLVDLPKESLK